MFQLNIRFFIFGIGHADIVKRKLLNLNSFMTSEVSPFPEPIYIETVLKEWKLYLDLLPEKPVLRELHLGGGTPTFFESDNLNHLIKSILDSVVLHKDYEFSFEGHPNNTTREHLQALYDVGFRRVKWATDYWVGYGGDLP